MNPIATGVMPADDIASLRSFAEIIWKSTYQDMLPQGQISYMLDRFYDPDLLKQQVAAGHPLIAARIGDELVGFAHLFMDGHQSQLDKLYVSPLFQRIGVGRSLFHEVKRHALAAGCSLMTLRVNRQNATAIAVYERLGFGIISTHRKDIGGGYVMDDYLMLMDLLPDPPSKIGDLP